MSNNTEVEAPLLPDGYFFRVTASRDHWDSLEYIVELRKRGRFFSTRLRVEKATFAEPTYVRRRMLSLKAWLESQNVIDKIVGEYPPKRVIGG